MVSVTNISKAYGPQVLFRNTTFSIGDRARIGMIGPNGAGKTTFLKMLVGEEHPDEGEVRLPKNFRVALLRQEWSPHKGDTILEGALREHPLWFNARAKLRELEARIAKTHAEADMAEYHDEEQTFLALGGYSVDQQAKEILTGLGFKADELGNQAIELSGGWRIRCHMAGLLLQNADLLLLDEPTNHLDVETVVWLESFLFAYPHAVLIISHDRRLIQRLSEDILEFAPPTLTLWPGTLDQYERNKDQRIEHLEAEIANKEREIARLKEFVDRFRAKASKARQAQNRLRTSEHYEDELEKMKANMPVISKRPSKFKLRLTHRLPRKVIEVRSGIFGYAPEQPLFDLEYCIVEGGKKIGIIGVNGVGKSTFLKSCAGELPLLGGKLETSETVKIGYFSQHRMEELPRGFTGLEYLYDTASGNTMQEVRGVAATLGLSANDLDKPLEILSGGEKARVSLSKILLARPGLLLLDEPTNHLDMEACQALVRGLSDYEGTVLVVSHNRDFLDSLVEYVLEIVPGRATIHHGSYSEWFAKKSGVVAAERSESQSGPKKSSGKKTKEQKRAEAIERQMRSSQSRSTKDELRDLEKELEARKSEKKEIEAALCQPDSPQKPDFSTWLKRQGQLAIEIGALETKWLELSEKIEAAGEGFKEG